MHKQSFLRDLVSSRLGLAVVGNDALGVAASEVVMDLPKVRREVLYGPLLFGLS